ncbi:hypothetical protein TVAGG3_0723030 [Trichomonas vaginalis G3]|uniref:hypothetical protein n=1 Tax=Trichomonas vaginalis (strain ATCC PRA-98 / G3) TaxID=412133 RepID=UPI0021E53AAE|nr:hypothetical protein TVAGG3_0723030 [Trichomonas vaginalis G3]KAI5510716.1 hypothetical protein TVAGG3_0723030 [Trichomonas vaginalis G3]
MLLLFSILLSIKCIPLFIQCFLFLIKVFSLIKVLLLHSVHNELPLFIQVFHLLHQGASSSLHHQTPTDVSLNLLSSNAPLFKQSTSSLHQDASSSSTKYFLS